MSVRKNMLTRFFTSGISVIASCFLPIVTHAEEPFTIVALPDTQNYVNDIAHAQLFTQQTQWIADQIVVQGNPRNIQFVSHLGDVVSNAGNSIEWQRADVSMDALDGVVKYSVLPGNHDYMAGSTKSSGTDAYLNYFGPDRFATYSWYGGADPSGNNSYQRFNAGGFDFLHMSLEWNPTQNVPFRETSPLEWAQSVIDSNPNTPVILSTHEYVQDNPASRSTDGEALWDQFIRSNDQVFLVLNGHFHSFGFPYGGQHHQVSINDAGRPVFEVLQNYQSFSSGGDGWLRLIDFDIPNDKLAFTTYSPSLDSYLSTEVEQFGTSAGQFELDIDFSTRLVPVMVPPVIPGDFDADHNVNGVDFLHWQRGGSPTPHSIGDLQDWQAAYVPSAVVDLEPIAVPEPSGVAILLMSIAVSDWRFRT